MNYILLFLYKTLKLNNSKLKYSDFFAKIWTIFVTIFYKYKSEESWTKLKFKYNQLNLDAPISETQTL